MSDLQSGDYQDFLTTLKVHQSICRGLARLRICATACCTITQELPDYFP